MSLSRRSLLRSGAATGAMLVAAPLRGLAAPLQSPQGLGTVAGAERGSRLYPGTRVAHGDLHNHSHLSDGAGDPDLVFASIRSAGLDFAALTDHSTVSWGATGAADPCASTGPYVHGQRHDCQSLAGITESAWARTAALADAADRPNTFTAIRGFEWSSPFLGHVNVWFSRRWIDPLHTAGIGPEGLGQHLHAVPGLGPAAQPHLDAALRGNPLRTGMTPFYAWLATDPSTPGIGGGADGLAGFNHPGRETGRFSYFAYDPAMAERIVSMEIFNRGEDYLFEGFAQGQPSPLVECLNAGWRVGLVGVTDEHGTRWGFEPGKGRAGLWLHALNRAGVRDALRNRRFFATREEGLRLDASAGGVRMGRTLRHGGGPVEFAVDIDAGPDSWGRTVEVQVLRPGSAYPEVIHTEPATIPTPQQPVIRFTVDLDPDDGDWVVLRVADPALPNRQPGPAGHPCNTLALAYTSPWWLQAAR